MSIELMLAVLAGSLLQGHRPRRARAIGPAAPCAEPALIAAATEPGANLSIDVLSDAIRRFHIVYGLPEPKDNQP